VSLLKGDTAACTPGNLLGVAKLSNHALQGQPALIVEIFASTGLLKGLHPMSHKLEGEGANNPENHDHHNDFNEGKTLLAANRCSHVQFFRRAGHWTRLEILH
jgi:hypothetical protein